MVAFMSLLASLSECAKYVSPGWAPGKQCVPSLTVTSPWWQVFTMTPVLQILQRRFDHSHETKEVHLVRKPWQQQASKAAAGRWGS